MTPHLNGLGRILFAQPEPAAASLIDGMIGLLAITNTMLVVWVAILMLSPAISRAFCLTILGLFTYGFALSMTAWLPVTHLPGAPLLLHGQQTVALALLVTVGLFFSVFAARLLDVLFRRF